MSVRPILLHLLLWGASAPAQEPVYRLRWTMNHPYMGFLLVPSTGGSWATMSDPFTDSLWDAVPLPGNRHYLLNGGSTLLQSLRLLDLDARVYATLVTLPLSPPWGSDRAHGFFIDQEGTLTAFRGGIGWCRLQSDLQWTQWLPPTVPSGRLLPDLDTGDFILSGSTGVFRIRSTGTVSMLHSQYLDLTAQDPETGALLGWSGNALMELRGDGPPVPTPINWSPLYYPYLVGIDETPSALGEYVLTAASSRGLGTIVARVSRHGCHGR